MQSTLPHRVDDGTASHAMGLVQELRNFGGFWRRSGRGEELAGLVAIGLEPTFIDGLETAVRGALGGVEFVRADRLLEDLPPRASLLRAAASNGAYELDFSLRLPPSAKRIGALVGAGIGVALAIGLVLQGAWSNDLDESRAELVALRLFREESLNVSDQVRADRSSRALLDRQLQELRVLTQGGLPLDELLEVSQRALDGQTHVLSIGATPKGDGFEVTFSADTPSGTSVSQEALTHAREELEKAGLFRRVKLIPPDQLPTPGSNRPLLFTIEAQLGGAR